MSTPPTKTEVPALADLHNHLGQTHNQYELRFEGHALLSRDPELLALLVRRVKQVQAAAAPRWSDGPAAAATHAATRSADAAWQELRALCLERLGAYEVALAELQQARILAGPLGVDATHEVTRGQYLLSRYHRDFADEERDTRDPGLLRELRQALLAVVARLVALLAEMTDDQAAAFQDDLDWLRKQAEIFAQERAAIVRTQAPTELSTHVSILAELANAQFDRHQRHFAQQPPLSSRPGLLADMVANLEDTAARMIALRQAAPQAQHNDANLAVVHKRLAVWREELASLTQLHARAGRQERLDHLREAVGAELRLYNRAVVGRAPGDAKVLVLLGTQCDRLHELARQLVALCDGVQDCPGAATLAKARDARTTLTRAWFQLLAAATTA